MRRAVIAAAVAAAALASVAVAQQTIYPTLPVLTGDEYIQLAFPNTYGPIYAKTSQLLAGSPVATSSTVGTVKPDNTTITVAGDGTITGLAATPVATNSVTGKVKPDTTTITVAVDGTLSTGVQPIAKGGTAATTAQAAAISLAVPYILKNTGAASPHNGDTNAAILGWVNIPGGAMGANGCVDIAAVWGVTGSAGSWVMNIHAIAGTSNGTTAGTTLQSNTVSAGLNVRSSHLICNLNDAASQAMYQNAAGSFTASSNAYTASSIDTTAAWTVSINGKLNNGADTITLKHLHATLLNGS